MDELWSATGETSVCRKIYKPNQMFPKDTTSVIKNPGDEYRYLLSLILPVIRESNFAFAIEVEGELIDVYYISDRLAQNSLKTPILFLK